jgi:tripartite-type tricarboxylate transporter receptor subunit TctC
MRTVHALALASLVALSAPPALGQSYPAKPLRMIIPFAPGGQSDTIGRIVAQRLSEAFNQPVVAENRPGATTTLGAEYVAKQPADGYTLLLAAPPFVITQYVYPKLGYDGQRDFAPVSLVSVAPLVAVATPSFKPKDLGELVALAKAEPGMSYPSVGSGSTPHLTGELFKQRTGVDIVHVPYKSGGQAITDLLGRRTSFYFGPTSEVVPHIRGGKLRPIAVLNSKRTALLPDVPTAAEQGFAYLEAVSWSAVLVAATTPAEIVTRLSSEIARAFAATELRERLAAQGAEVVASTPDELAAFLKAEHARWGPLVRAVGLKPD